MGVETVWREHYMAQKRRADRAKESLEYLRISLDTVLSAYEKRAENYLEIVDTGSSMYEEGRLAVCKRIRRVMCEAEEVRRLLEKKD